MDNSKNYGRDIYVDKTVIAKHLKNIFNDKELNKNQVCAKFAHTANDEKKYKTYQLFKLIGYFLMEH